MRTTRYTIPIRDLEDIESLEKQPYDESGDRQECL